MPIISMVRRSVLALALTLPWLASVPAHAQGDGPLSACLEQSGRQAEVLEACLVEHQQELLERYDLPADGAQRVHAFIEAHPHAWDRLEDLIGRLENRRDRADDQRDRREDRLDRREDRLDDECDLEDLFGRRENARDRLATRWDLRH